MKDTAGRYGPLHPWLGRMGYRVAHPVLRRFAARRGVLTPADADARARSGALAARLARGEPAFLVGLGAGGHNSGASLVAIGPNGEVSLLGSHQEERFTGVRFHADYPEHSLEEIRRQLEENGLTPDDVDGWLASFDYVELFARGVEILCEELPKSAALAHPDVYRRELMGLWGIFRAAARIERQLGCRRPVRIIGMPHHGNHAYLAWAMSPFARSQERTVVGVLDANGDAGAITAYLAEGGVLRPLVGNRRLWDSLGHFYAFMSSSFGGWTLGAAEGRWMAAAAYGNSHRRTNRRYPAVRSLLRLSEGGRVEVNRELVNWHNAGARKPFAEASHELLGEPIPQERLSNPDETLRFDAEAAILPDRVDLAAATQMVLEDALCHVVDHWLRMTRSRNLVLTGGVAFNCVGNMRLLERFGESYFAEVLGRREARLRLWVPPVPGDEGVHAGAAFHFALTSGARPGPPLQHCFYCGRGVRSAELEQILKAHPGVVYRRIGDVSLRREQFATADLLAYLVAGGGIVGLFRWSAEMGRRALGNRSILANACDRRSRDAINRDVKYREGFRPVAPICTREAAERWFLLEPGASAAGWNAYRWMNLAARARPEALERIPAVIHRDGTARLQIVPEEDCFLMSFLAGLGERVGVEIAVHTSLNVGTPIVQDPRQALDALMRSRGLDGILFLADDGPAYLAWHRAVAGGTLPAIERWLSEWRPGRPGSRTS